MNLSPDTLIGYYRNHSETTPETITLQELVMKIREPERDTIRLVSDSKQAYTDAGGGKAGKDAAKPFKAQLPCVTLSATGTRRSPDIASGLMNVDLDELGDRLSEIRDKLAADPHIVIRPFVSPSGDGLKAAMRVPVIPKGEESEMRAQHLKHFEAMQNYCTQVFGIAPDRSTCDLMRLCYLSDDARCSLNQNAQELDIVRWTPPEEERPENQSSVPGNTKGDIKEIVPAHVVEAMLMSIPPRPERDVWLKVAAAVRNSIGSTDTAVEMLCRWSPEEEEGEYRRLLTSPFPRIGFGTLFWHAMEHGLAGVVRRFFYGGKVGYSVWNKDGVGFVPLTSESSVKQHLKEYRVPKPMLDSIMCRIREEQLVQHIGPIAGHKPGLHKFNNDSFLVTTGPTIIEGKMGCGHYIQDFFRGLLDDEAHPDQYQTFLNWLSHARKAVLRGERAQTPAIVFTGARGDGKSLAIEIIKHCLGGRTAKAYKFFAGDDQFNSELAGAELLVSDDDAVSKDHRARLQFAKAIKGNLFSDSMRIRGMFTAGFGCAPVHALIIACNDEPEDLRVLPELDGQMCDKIILLKTGRGEFPSDSTDHMGSIRRAIAEALPGFLYDLDRRDMQKAYDDRGRLKCFWHPEIIQAIDLLSPEYQLLQLIHQVEDVMKLVTWRGTAAKLSELLTDRDGSTWHAAGKLLSWPTACGTYLSRLAQKEGTGVTLGPLDRNKIQNYNISIAPAGGEEERLAA